MWENTFQNHCEVCSIRLHSWFHLGTWAPQAKMLRFYIAMKRILPCNWNWKNRPLKEAPQAPILPKFWEIIRNIIRNLCGKISNLVWEIPTNMLVFPQITPYLDHCPRPWKRVKVIRDHIQCCSENTRCLNRTRMKPLVPFTAARVSLWRVDWQRHRRITSQFQ